MLDIIIILEQHDIRTYIPPMLDYLSDRGKSSTIIIHCHEDIGDNAGTLNGSPLSEGAMPGGLPRQIRHSSSWAVMLTVCNRTTAYR